MKTKTFDLVVTRHQGLVEYLNELGYIREDTVVSSHATMEMVVGRHVIGVLPHSLSCLTASFSEIPLKLTPEMRGKELSCKDVKKIAGTLITYEVIRVRRDQTQCPMDNPSGLACLEAIAGGYCQQECLNN